LFTVTLNCTLQLGFPATAAEHFKSQVNPIDGYARTTSGDYFGYRARSATDIQHAHSRSQIHFIHQVQDLLTVCRGQVPSGGAFVKKPAMMLINLL